MMLVLIGRIPFPNLQWPAYYGLNAAHFVRYPLNDPGSCFCWSTSVHLLFQATYPPGSVSIFSLLLIACITVTPHAGLQAGTDFGSSAILVGQQYAFLYVPSLGPLRFPLRGRRRTPRAAKGHLGNSRYL